MNFLVSNRGNTEYGHGNATEQGDLQAGAEAVRTGGPCLVGIDQDLVDLGFC
jgi:hypothetical protein